MVMTKAYLLLIALLFVMPFVTASDVCSPTEGVCSTSACNEPYNEPAAVDWEFNDFGDGSCDAELDMMTHYAVRAYDYCSTILFGMSEGDCVIVEDYSDFVLPPNIYACPTYESNGNESVSSEDCFCIEGGMMGEGTCATYSFDDLFNFSAPMFQASSNGNGGDTTAPLVNITLNTSTLEAGIDSINVSWIAEDDVALDVVELNVSFPNGTLLFTSSIAISEVVLSPGNLSVLGVYNVSLFANDSSGNANSTYETFVVHDTTPPVVVIHSPLNISYSDNDVLVNITATDSFLDSVWFNWNGSNTSFSSPVLTAFPDGAHALHAWANDSSGNEGFANVSFVVSSASPVPSVISDLSGVRDMVLIGLNLLALVILVSAAMLLVMGGADVTINALVSLAVFAVGFAVLLLVGSVLISLVYAFISLFF